MDKHELIHSHMNLAETLARKKKRTVNKNIYYEELESAAYHGLVDAADRYDIKTRVPFRNYAAFRIIGEMNDYISELMWGVNPLPADFNLSVDTYYDTELIAKEVLRKLPCEVGQIFRWYFCDGDTLKDIGKKLGMSESMVSKIMKRYKGEMRKRREEIFDI